jgi:hypothetical protein
MSSDLGGANDAWQAGEDKVRRSKLNFVDLAGSERVTKTGIDGHTLKEAKYINLSLHFLEQVIIALQVGQLGYSWGRACRAAAARLYGMSLVCGMRVARGAEIAAIGSASRHEHACRPLRPLVCCVLKVLVAGPSGPAAASHGHGSRFSSFTPGQAEHALDCTL